MYETNHLISAFIETSHEVIKDTVIPSTIYKEIKITFRNSPTTTTLTSVTMVSTQITSYVTKTVRAQATQNPFNPFAAFGWSEEKMIKLQNYDIIWKKNTKNHKQWKRQKLWLWYKFLMGLPMLCLLCQEFSQTCILGNCHFWRFMYAVKM